MIQLPSPTPNNQTILEHIESDEFTQLNTLDRSAYKLFKMMMEVHNFTVMIRRTQAWVKKDGEGRWLGTLGMVQRRIVDVAITAARHEEDRYGQVETTTHGYFIQ